MNKQYVNLHQLQFVSHKLIYWIIVSSGIWSSLVIYAAISYYYFWYIVCWSLSFPRAVSALTLCASFAVPSPKVQLCNRLVWTSRFCPLNSPDLSTFISKYGAASLSEISAGCGWFEAESDWCVRWSVTERYWRHWSVAQTSPCLHSSHRRTFLIFIVI